MFTASRRQYHKCSACGYWIFDLKLTACPKCYSTQIKFKSSGSSMVRNAERDEKRI